jgi:hypothetical protein
MCTVLLADEYLLHAAVMVHCISSCCSRPVLLYLLLYAPIAVCNTAAAGKLSEEYYRCMHTVAAKRQRLLADQPRCSITLY